MSLYLTLFVVGMVHKIWILIYKNFIEPKIFKKYYEKVELDEYLKSIK